MNLKSIFALILTLVSISNFGQTNNVIISPNIQMSKDSIVTKQLISSLNNFLIAKEKPNEENNFVWDIEKENLETFILLDEMKGIEKSGKFKDDNFFKPYFTNLVKLNDNEYYIQVSYLGVNENNPMLRASFELIANKENDQFKFSSTLIRNSSSWKTKKIGNFNFHFKNILNDKTASTYVKAVNSFDKKLNATNKQTDIYFAGDFPDLLKMIGVEYKLDYNGKETSGGFSSVSKNRLLVIKGDKDTNFDNFDMHDLWHERLHNAVSTKTINKPIDEGCAYIYGGSWGMSWKEIFKKFNQKVANNKQTNWLDLYGKFDNFGDSKEKHLMAEYVINALIVQKIEKEKGFPSVIEFVSCGKYQKDNENYFQSLEKLAGINRTNFDEKVWELINKEK